MDNNLKGKVNSIYFVLFSLLAGIFGPPQDLSRYWT